MIRGYVSSDEDDYGDYGDYDDYDFGYSDPLVIEKNYSFSLPEIQTKEVKEKLLSALEESEKIQRFFQAIDDVDLTTLDQLISLGVSPDSTDEQEWTPLMRACGMGNFDLVQFLLEHGADPNIHRGRNVLEEIKALDVKISRISSPNLQIFTFPHGELFTPLMTCCTYTLVEEDSKLRCVRLLLEHGANVNAKDKYRTTALMYACDSSYRDIVYELLEAPEVDVNIQDKEGWTALFHAVNQNDRELVEKLLSYKPDLELKDRYERTVINLALDRDFKKVAEALGYIEEILPDCEKKLELSDRLLKELPDAKGQGGFFTDAEEILHAFNQLNVKNVSLPDLLNATEKDLYDIGVKLHPDRLNILCKGIHRYHLQPWKSSSMHQITQEVPLSLENIVAMTGSFAKHLTIANASLRYLDARISSRQNEETVAVEKETIILLINTYNSAEKLKALLKEIIKRTAEIKLEIAADYIYPIEKVKFGRKLLNFFWYGMGAAFTGFFIFYNKPNLYFRKLKQSFSLI